MKNEKNKDSRLSQIIAKISFIFEYLCAIALAVVFALYCLFQKENLARQGRKLLYAFLPENARFLKKSPAALRSRYGVQKY